MSDSNEAAKQANPHALLLAELLDSRIQKSEREHAAKREIERLTAALRAQPGPVSMDDVEWAGKAHLADCEARNQKLHAACTALAALVQRDRVALYEAHHYPHSGEIDDEGREALAEYDAALALADQAMGSE